MQSLDNALECVSLKVGAAGLKAFGAAGAEAAAFNNGEAADEIVVVPVEVLMDHHILVRIVVVPFGGVSICGSFHGGCGACGSSCRGLVVHLGSVVAVVIVEVLSITLEVGAAGYVGACFENGSSR